jgi:NAD+ diphosphatase
MEKGPLRWASLDEMFVPSLSPSGPSEGAPLVISVRGNEVALSQAAGGVDTNPVAALFVGALHGRHCWAVDVNSDATGPHGPEEFVDLMRLFGDVDEATWIAAGSAVQLVEWARNHRYCGRCGAPTEEAPGERAQRCPRCSLLAFPRLAPAVITLVERDDGSALLARNARWTTGMYSCLAGFVEPGETIEGAVRREVAEEVGIELAGMRYHGSQPWPFPHSLMLGFHARYGSGRISCDGREIAEARWFSPHQLPQLPGPISIARWLIDDWLARCGRSAPAP